MKPDHQQSGVCKTEKPLWHFNLRRISTSRAEILDLNKSASKITKNQFENNKSSAKNDHKSLQFINKSFDDYIYNIKQDKKHSNSMLTSINLINTSQIDRSSSEFFSNDDSVLLQHNDLDNNKSDNSIDEKLSNNKDIEFDMNRSLIDQIYSIKDKLVKIKRLSDSSDAEDGASYKKLSKIDTYVLKANAKLNSLKVSLFDKFKTFSFKHLENLLFFRT